MNAVILQGTLTRTEILPLLDAQGKINAEAIFEHPPHTLILAGVRYKIKTPVPRWVRREVCFDVVVTFMPIFDLYIVASIADVLAKLEKMETPDGPDTRGKDDRSADDNQSRPDGD